MPEDKRIMDLPYATLPLTGAEYSEIVQGGANKKVPVSNYAGSSLVQVTVTTTGGTITLDLNSQVQRMFVGSASFAGPKNIALSNTGSGLVINAVFTLTNVAAVITFPTSFTMQTTDNRWNDGAHTFTPAGTGKHEFSATWDGTDWNLKVSDVYS